MEYIKKIGEKPLYNDGIGFCECWDFSKANYCKEARIEAITKIAAVCYESKKIQGSLRIFNMLEAESLGLPSSSFEYVPILISKEDYNKVKVEVEEKLDHPFILNMLRYGNWVNDENDTSKWYLLTNFRAVLYDTQKHGIESIDFKEYYNTTEDELQIISKNTYTFFNKIPIFVARQLVRHRNQLLQELSRRYTNNKTSPIEFYEKDGNVDIINENKSALSTYNKLVDSQTMKPEDARAILGSGMYTKIWSGWNVDGFANFIKLRTKVTAQKEIVDLAEACRALKK